MNDSPSSKKSLLWFLIPAVFLILAGTSLFYFFFFLKPHLVSIEISHHLPIPFGETIGLRATGKYSDKSTRDMTNLVEWKTSAPEVLAMDGNKGQAKGSGQGKALVTVKDPETGVMGSAIFTVQQAALVAVNILPGSSSVIAGQKLELAAEGRFEDGKTMDITRALDWSSSNPDIASINKPGNDKVLVESSKEGVADIIAKDPATAIKASIRLTVTEPELVSMEIEPSAQATPLGKPLTLTAIGTFSNGEKSEISSSIEWTSSDSNLATVKSINGAQAQAVPKGLGKVTIYCISKKGMSASATINISKKVLVSLAIIKGRSFIPLGAGKQFLARSKYSDGSTEVLKSSVEWSSSAPLVADFSKNARKKGLLISKSMGSTTIFVKDLKSGISGSASFTVGPARLLSIHISPASPFVAAGDTLKLTASGQYTDNSKIDLTSSLRWGSSMPSTAMVENSSGKKGLINAIAIGSATVSAIDPRTGLRGIAHVSVTMAKLISISLTPENLRLHIGEKSQMTAKGNFSDGSSRPVTEMLDWSTDKPEVLYADDSRADKGKLTASSTGVCSVLVKDPATGVTGVSSVEVLAARLSSISITPKNPMLPLGTGVKLEVRGEFSDKSEKNVSPQMEWHSSNEKIAEIDNQGNLTSLSQGETRILAKDPESGVQEEILVTVIKPKLKSINITPENPVIYIDKLQQFKAIGRYSDGTSVDLTAGLDWSSSDDTIIMVRNNKGWKGLATCHSVGSSIIKASVPGSGVSGSTLLTGKVKWQ